MFDLLQVDCFNHLANSLNYEYRNRTYENEVSI